jgi:tetratricopeptide (TPR) repeat protein
MAVLGGARLAIVLGVVACSVSSPSGARAAEAAQNATGDRATLAVARSSAELQYRKGVEAYGNGRYTEAIELFIKADQLSPSAALSFNIARAYEKLTDSRSALAWYRDYLRRAPDAGDADQVAQLAERLETELAQRGLEQVTVMSAPAGATVLVDERPVGVTPWTGELPTGNHQISLRLRGYADTGRAITLTPADSMDVNVTLYPDTQAPLAIAGPVAPAASPATGAAAGMKNTARPLRTAGFVALGAGAAALGGALGFELSRKSAETDARNEPEQLRAARYVDTAESRATAARVFAGLGAAFAVTGGVLLVLDARKEAKKETGLTRVGLGCTGGACGLAASGAFQ